MPLRQTIHASSCYLLLSLICVSGLPHAAGQETPAAQESNDAKPKNLPEGINDSFLDPNMSVDDFVKRFEVESREVVACQAGILKALQLEPGMSIADVGAGTGLYIAPLSKLTGKDGKVYAIDIAPNFVKHLRQRVKAEKLDNVEVVLCSDRHVNLKPNSIDRALICDVYHHFEYPTSSMKSILEALRPGGQLVLVDFHREIEGERREWMMNHIRAPLEVFKQEIVDAGFEFTKEVKVSGFKENYLLRFQKPGK